jgi:hypothetical protein
MLSRLDFFHAQTDPASRQQHETNSWLLTYVLLCVCVAGAQRLPEVAIPENYELIFAPGRQLRRLHHSHAHGFEEAGVSYNFALLPRKEIGCNTQQSNING